MIKVDKVTSEKNAKTVARSFDRSLVTQEMLYNVLVGCLDLMEKIASRFCLKCPWFCLWKIPWKIPIFVDSRRFSILDNPWYWNNASMHRAGVALQTPKNVYYERRNSAMILFANQRPQFSPKPWIMGMDKPKMNPRCSNMAWFKHQNWTVDWLI